MVETQCPTALEAGAAEDQVHVRVSRREVRHGVAERLLAAEFDILAGQVLQHRRRYAVSIQRVNSKNIMIQANHVFSYFAITVIFPELQRQVRARVEVVEDLEGDLSPAPSGLDVSDQTPELRPLPPARLDDRVAGVCLSRRRPPPCPARVSPGCGAETFYVM